MQYTFSAGIRILDTATYSSLTDAQRKEARELLFQAIQPVVDAMGVFDTDTPKDFIQIHLQTTAGAEWSLGESLNVGMWYYIDPITGRRVCLRDYVLLQAGVESLTTVNVAGKDLKSAFYIQQTAVN